MRLATVPAVEFFFDPHVCGPPSTFGMDRWAGWLTWTCTTGGGRWHIEHFDAEDGQYLGCSWILNT